MRLTNYGKRRKGSLWMLISASVWSRQLDEEECRLLIIAGGSGLFSGFCRHKNKVLDELRSLENSKEQHES